MRRTELSQYEPVLTPYDVAAILKVEYRTAMNLIKSGKLKSIKLGRIYRVYKYWLEEFMEIT